MPNCPKASLYEYVIVPDTPELFIMASSFNIIIPSPYSVIEFIYWFIVYSSSVLLSIITFPTTELSSEIVIASSVSISSIPSLYENSGNSFLR